jgi:hypothetical protein
MSLSPSRVISKCVCVNIDTGEEQSPFFNPTEFETQISATYERKRPLGHAHSNLQYSGTDNPVINLEFFLLTQTAENHTLNAEFLNFMHGFLYPMRAANSVRTGSPPRLLFIWPKVLSLSTRVTAINTRYVRFRSSDLAAVQQIMTCTLEENRDFRWTYEDQVSAGFLRNGDR